MKERPILFSGPMVRAILSGTKTQTRRVVKPSPIQFDNALAPGDWWPHGKRTTNLRHPSAWKACPYGQPGDRLWVRETCIIAPPHFSDDDRRGQHVTDYQGRPRLIQYLATAPDREGAENYRLKGTPSIHMPRWASRLTLDLTQVRVERLQDITEEDAKAEGVDHDFAFSEGLISRLGGMRPMLVGCFAELWDDLNAKRGFGWDTNPWVWVLTSKRVEATEVAA